TTASALAGQLAGAGVRPGDRIAVWHGDTTAIHVLFIAIERCGAVVVGVGARAGTREVTAILQGAEPRMLVTDPPRQAHAESVATVIGCPLLTLDELSVGVEPQTPDARLGPDDVFLINSTSGTTGLPKCVVHTQNRWYYFHQQAVANGLL
ncbi:class I adenylate-forming enzyme family protein, partial [Mycolicibacterium sp. CBMA 361]